MQGRAAARRRVLRRCAGWTLAAGAAAALPGCAGVGAVQTAQVMAAPPAALPRRSELTATPFFPQTAYHCGPAALATALGAAGIPADPQRLADAVFLPARQGSLQVEMLAATRRQGALAVRLPRNLASVLREVAAGRPVVVLQNLGIQWLPKWHYAVLIGYDLDQRTAVLRSGVTEREVVDLATFEHTWARGERWAFAVLPPGQLPLSAIEPVVTEAVVAFERVATPDDAARAYAAAWRRWPANPTLGMGLGNARYAGGDYYAAAAAFENMAKRHDSAAAWNNLAQARLKLGQRAAALEAANKAVERARSADPQWLAAARSTLADVQGPAAR